jgi:hypothetical protein
LTGLGWLMIASGIWGLLFPRANLSGLIETFAPSHRRPSPTPIRLAALTSLVAGVALVLLS